MTTPTNSSQQPARAGGNFRWVICTLLFFSVALNYIDRNIIGILKPHLSEKLGWDENDYGTIAAGFSFAYAFGYLIGGRLIQRFGVRYGLPGFVFFWSLAAMAHGLCGFIPAESVFRLGTFALPATALGFLCARIALGLTEGGNFPGAIKAVAEWFPQKERALATGLFNAGTNVGAVICPVGVPWLLKHVGWESTFFITGGLGFVWLFAWWFLYESPERSKRVSKSELAYIQGGKTITAEAAAAEKKETMPWGRLLSYRAVWAYIIAGILAGPVWGFYQFFLPDFLYKRYNLDLQQTGIWTGVFYALAAVGGVFFGWLAGKLFDRGWTINATRKVALLICAVSVVPVFFAPYVPSIWLTVFIVGVAGSAHQGWSANLFSFVSDTMPKKAISSVVGLGGFVTYFTGGVVSKATGWILQETGSYVYVFAWASLMYVLSLVAIQLLVPRIPQTPEEA
ncbi:MFS transporter [Ereboglobus luteus]|uniref:MFS transporter n=1 Tax=Ereboglobus luteus TaxID=1796921 RepID=A0A2U8E1L9_9BACT|nr:MFS transporter [Ereboglobus luteus]AWI08757.1 MFS transporter [Ereboglobus luteus]